MLRPLWMLPPLFLFALPAQQPATAPAAAVPVAAAAAADVPANPVAASKPVKVTPELLAKAKKTYGYDCAVCHGATGDGKGDLVADMKLSLKDYTDPASLKDLSDAQIFAIIKDGKGKMTGEGDRAKQDDVWALVAVVRSFAKK
jgi:mono/diheme cytochrome c family protein